MGICENHAFFGESLNIGHLNLRVDIEWARVSVSHIVNKNKYDVRLRVFFDRSRACLILQKGQRKKNNGSAIQCGSAYCTSLCVATLLNLDHIGVHDVVVSVTTVRRAKLFCYPDSAAGDKCT